MTTSATLPSTAGSIHGGFPIVTEDMTASESTFEVPRPLKRRQPSAVGDPCKKRRKQATPVRISSTDSEVPTEGKQPVLSPEPESRCFVCQVVFSTMEQLQSHITAEHSHIQCKKEQEDLVHNFERAETPYQLPANNKSDLSWITDIPNKDWINSNMHNLQFSPAGSVFLPLPTFNQTESIPSRQPIRIFNPDAYCDLCNKEFCNKYFLKTHKANKHGIYSDPPAAEPVPTSVNIPNYAANLKIPTSSSENASSKLDSKMQPPSINLFADIFPPFPNKIYHKVSKQGIFDLETDTISLDLTTSTLSNGQNDNLQEEANPEENSSPKLPDPNHIKNEYNSDQETSYYSSPSKLSPVRESEMSSRLRRIGVMNPKAFCEICCKEYCNKYFLRTHKMKRHGIYVPEEVKDKSDWPSNIQTSPLNLIMTEQTSSSSSGGERKLTSPTDISCETCGIKFQNAALAQLHSVNVHPRLQPEMAHDDKKPEEQNNSSAPTAPTAPEKSNNASTDAISEDLQKLQSMILQLNNLEVGRVLSLCHFCNKEFENRYFLHAHMITEHGFTTEETGGTDKNSEVESSSNNNTVCDLCGKDVQSVEEMKRHLVELHPNNQMKGGDGFAADADKGLSRLPLAVEKRTSTNVTPSSSYCEICNKELCNKYFMKTHMQRMHGIEIENGAQIGGVICDICNKELCSKYFLRVHKHNTHGIVEYGTSLLQPGRKGDAEQGAVVPADSDSALKAVDLADLSHRYFTHFTEVCTICSRRFRSTKWLKAHLLTDHGQAGAEKWAELEQQLQQPTTQNPKAKSTLDASPTLKIPNGNQEPCQVPRLQNVLSTIFGADDTTKNYHCSFCTFSTPVLPFLFVHERSHSIQAQDGENSSQLKCPVCSLTFFHGELLQHHLFTQHPLFPVPPPPPHFNGSGEGGKAESLKDFSESLDEEEVKGAKRKPSTKVDLFPEVGQSLKDVVHKWQLPATYALPQPGEGGNTSGFVMQAFLLDEPAAERRILPSVVFLPVVQQLSTTITSTFTLTPA